MYTATAKKYTALCLCLLLACLPFSCKGAEFFPEDTAAFLRQAVPNPSIGQTGGEWAVIGHLQAGMPKDDPYFSIYKDNLEKTLTEKAGVLSGNKYTEYARVSLALSALGEDPSNFRGFDLLAPLCEFDKVLRQGINGAVFALMAFSHGGRGDEEVVRRYLTELLGKQQACGGFGLSDDQPDTDVTAMAIRALCLYPGHAGVRDAVMAALAWLSAVQQADGGFLSREGTETAESASQVLLALKAAGYSENDPAFCKNGSSVRDNLLSFAQPNGGFRHTKQNLPVDLMASEQAYLALTAPAAYTFDSNKAWDFIRTLLDLSAQMQKGGNP